MSEETFATFVDIILPLPLQQAYTYRVPREWEKEVQTGKRVAIQFGKRKVYSALIYKVHHVPPAGYEAKYIYEVIDEFPVVTATQIKFWEWISRYYLCTLGDVMQAALPAAMKLESDTRIQANPAFEMGTVPIDDKEYLIWEALEIKHELTLDEISEIVQLKNVFPLIRSMVLKEMILLRENLTDKYHEKKVTCIRLSESWTTEEALEKLFQQLEKQAKQLNLLLAYLHLKNTHSTIDKALLLKTASVNAGPLQTLLKKNIFEAYEVSVDRIQLDATPPESFELNPDQQEAFLKINEAWKDKDSVLLHGVTGSGKTHVYVKLIQDQMAAGKQVLFLLPEIALTSQVVKRIRRYFGDQCISYHSRFNDQERVEIWNHVREGKYKVILGARSAVFLPFQSLGLCIVDEEHESSYKQQEPAPRYHARDAAMMLARLHGCKTLLGSATPSLEVWHLAKEGKYGWVQLNKRYHATELPLMETANLAEDRRVKRMLTDDFGPDLHAAIEEALSKNEQIILFQNRRGYAPFLSCNTCEWIPKCKNCDISLTYHKYIDSLKCHYCGYIQAMPKTCGACGSTGLSLKGTGTEKIEDELKTLFPQARVARLDLDAARSKHGHENIIRNFEEHQFDILVGTQMISKGLDFEKVSLVGVMNADSLLSFPDFRAHERAIQMLIQVGGRAGRKDLQGKVIIQTTMPNHFVLQALLAGAYEQLLEREREERQKFAYPPYFRLIRIVLKHKDYKTVEQAAIRLRYILNNSIQVSILGPESPYVSKIRNYHIKEMLVKVNRNNPDLDKIKSQIRQALQLLSAETAYRSVITFADADPA